MCVERMKMNESWTCILMSTMYHYDRRFASERENNRLKSKEKPSTISVNAIGEC